MFYKIIILLILVGCDKKISESKGDYNEVIIVSSLEDRNFVEPILNNYMFDDIIYTPEPEYIYKNTWIKPEGFNYYKDYSNIIIISLSDPPDKTIDSLFYYLHNNKTIDTYPITLNDIYAKPQNITLIKSLNQTKLKNDLNESVDQIKYNINKNIDTLFKRRQDLKKITLNRFIDSLTINTFNLNVNVDSDFKVIKYDEKDNFLWIGKGAITYDNNATYQWISFKKTNLINVEGNIELYEVFRENIKDLDSNIELINDYTQFEFIDKDNSSYYYQKMLYNHNLKMTGGPIIGFLLNDYEKKSSLIIYGLINAPGKSKLRLIKELESIIKNSIF